MTFSHRLSHCSDHSRYDTLSHDFSGSSHSDSGSSPSGSGSSHSHSSNNDTAPAVVAPAAGTEDDQDEDSESDTISLPPFRSLSFFGKLMRLLPGGKKRAKKKKVRKLTRRIRRRHHINTSPLLFTFSPVNQAKKLGLVYPRPKRTTPTAPVVVAPSPPVVNKVDESQSSLSKSGSQATASSSTAIGTNGTH